MSQSLRTDDLTIPQGTTWKMQWPLTDDTGAPLPLVGYTARCQFRARTNSVDTLAEFTTENQGIVLADSTLTLAVDPVASSAWEWTSARYDVELVSADGSTTRITQGQVSVSPEVTR